MTVIYMSGKGQIVLPKSIRDTHGFGPGSAFGIVHSKDGDLILRPIKSKSKLTLINHLRKFKGLGIPEIKAEVPPRV
jgi:AbrB family looped-hinge helix DNA binding protein